jgi:hypothetical protein
VAIEEFDRIEPTLGPLAGLPLPDQPGAPPPPISQERPCETRGPGLFLLASTPLIVISNGLLALASASQELRDTGTLAEILGYVAGYALFVPIAVVLVFLLGERFRNTGSALRVFFWTSMLGIVLSAQFLALRP